MLQIGDIVECAERRGHLRQHAVDRYSEARRFPHRSVELCRGRRQYSSDSFGECVIPFSESPLNTTGIGATEDDVSVLWLKQGASVSAAVQLLEKNASAIGLGQIFYGPTLAVNYGVGGLDPGQDPRTPDIIVTPNVGVTYSGSTTMIGDHGGFSHDDTNVLLLVSHPQFKPQIVSNGTTTMQVAPTIVKALGLDPQALDAVRMEGTQVLPEVTAALEK